MVIDLNMFCASVKQWIYYELEGEILLQSHAMAPYLDFVLDLVVVGCSLALHKYQYN